MLESLRHVVPPLLRHLGAYASLVGAEAESALATVRRRLLLALVAFFVGWLSLALGLVWLIAAVWDTPWRMWLLGGLCLGLAAVAIASASMVMRNPEEPFRKLRAEWAADRDVLRRLGSRLMEDRHA